METQFFGKSFQAILGESQSVQLPHSREFAFHSAGLFHFVIIWGIIWSTVSSVDIIATTDHYITELM